MCHDWTGDHEIKADEMEDYIEWRRQYHEPIGDEFDAPEQDEGPEPVEFSDEELEDMNRIWQESMRGCVEGGYVISDGQMEKLL